jgi:hypothetical protein
VKFDNLTRNFLVRPTKTAKDGKYQVVVQASDLFGGITLQYFSLTIIPEEEGKKTNNPKPEIL